MDSDEFAYIRNQRVRSQRDKPQDPPTKTSPVRSRRLSPQATAQTDRIPINPPLRSRSPSPQATVVARTSPTIKPDGTVHSSLSVIDPNTTVTSKPRSVQFNDIADVITISSQNQILEAYSDETDDNAPQFNRAKEREFEHTEKVDLSVLEASRNPDFKGKETTLYNRYEESSDSNDAKTVIGIQKHSESQTNVEHETTTEPPAQNSASSAESNIADGVPDNFSSLSLSVSQQVHEPARENTNATRSDSNSGNSQELLDSYKELIAKSNEKVRKERKGFLSRIFKKKSSPVDTTELKSPSVLTVVTPPPVARATPARKTLAKSIPPVARTTVATLIPPVAKPIPPAARATPESLKEELKEELKQIKLNLVDERINNLEKTLEYNQLVIGGYGDNYSSEEAKLLSKNIGQFKEYKKALKSGEGDEFEKKNDFTAAIVKDVQDQLQAIKNTEESNSDQYVW